MKPATDLEEFLACATSQTWLDTAVANESVLLIDHANCEKKAAATAMNLMYRYVGKSELLVKMSQLAREELLHFEQVVQLMDKRGIRYKRLSPSRYAAGLRQHIDQHNGEVLVDTLIVGALIEARSCERFARLAPLLDTELCRFYTSLLKSEARHYHDYLQLAQLYSNQDISARVKFFVAKEGQLINSPDSQFRFHSGVPVAARSQT